MVISLEVPEDVLVARLSGRPSVPAVLPYRLILHCLSCATHCRRKDPVTGEIYHMLWKVPKVRCAWTCSVHHCGSSLSWFAGPASAGPPDPAQGALLPCTLCAEAGRMMQDDAPESVKNRLAVYRKQKEEALAPRWEVPP